MAAGGFLTWRAGMVFVVTAVLGSGGCAGVGPFGARAVGPSAPAAPGSGASVPAASGSGASVPAVHVPPRAREMPASSDTAGHRPPAAEPAAGPGEAAASRRASETQDTSIGIVDGTTAGGTAARRPEDGTAAPREADRTRPAARQRVPRGALRELPDPARVTLLSTPPGATVWLDGTRLVRETPVENLRVAPGLHRIEFYLRDHEPVVIEREWVPGISDRVHAILEPPPARITLVSTPPGATVLVDGDPLPGKTPLWDVAVPPGRRTLAFRLADHEPVAVERQWRSGAIDLVEVTLPAWPARVGFQSMPAGAAVWLDGQPLPGTTPIEGALVSAGRHVVEFRLEAHETLRLERAWPANARDVVVVELVQLGGRVRFATFKAWERLEIDGAPVPLGPNEWRELAAGTHSVRAYSGGDVGGADFVVAPGGEATVELRWQRLGPDGDRYVFLPAARARLGSPNYAAENPPRTADIQGFWMSRTEVTVAEYRACVEAGRCDPPGTGPDCNWERAERADHPINCVSAADAEAYAAWMSGRDGLRYELPAADQWERAARGATGRPYPWGEEAPASRCNSCDRSCRFHHFKNRDVDDGWQETAPVGALAECRSAEGILDLVGNVAEWCRDGATGLYGVRGGSWSQIGALLDPSFPSQRPESERDPSIGFRLVVGHLGESLSR